jgi:hypothetical protein
MAIKIKIPILRDSFLRFSNSGDFHESIGPYIWLNSKHGK